MLKKKESLRIKRHRRIRKKIFGSEGRYRLCFSKSLKHIYTQIIDDVAGKTILTVSTLSKELKGKNKNSDNIKAAEMVGNLIAKKCLEKNIKKVVFDRGGYIYHGKVKTLADAARKEGLVF